MDIPRPDAFNETYLYEGKEKISPPDGGFHVAKRDG
jgi:hypothetical protein